MLELIELWKWIYTVYGEIAIFITVIIFSWLWDRWLRGKPLSAITVPWLMTALGCLLLGLGVLYQDGGVAVCGLGLAFYWTKRLRTIAELKELEDILIVYIDALGRSWMQEVKKVLEKHIEEYLSGKSITVRKRKG